MFEKKNSQEGSELVISRTFEAPRELVFKVWTEPTHLLKWWGPKHFTSPKIEVDLRVGGQFLFCMQAPDGKKYWNCGVFQEIVRPEKIVSSMYFSDENGTILDPAAYGMTGFPKETRDEVTFEAVSPSKTKVTIRRNHSTHLADKFGEVEGWNQSLDKFAEELAASK